MNYIKVLCAVKAGIFSFILETYMSSVKGRPLCYCLTILMSYDTDKLTEAFLNQKNSKKLPSQISKRALMRLVQIDNATELNDLRIPSSNHLKSLRGDKKGRYSIRINNRWRICFKFENGNAFDVEIVDYH